MIEEGEQAPDFRLPAVADGERREVGLADHLEENVVVLGFYPGDFNPACDGQSTGLDDLDLFTMQKDVAVLGISGDSVHSHRAFAAEYDLHVPLLSDVDGEATEAYGVGADDPGSLTRRAVVVVDPEGTVRYAWAAESLEDLPDVGRVRAAVEGVGGGEMALARYRVGHAHYVEGRRAFSSATAGFEDREWLLAKHDFAQAAGEFAEAADTFDTAARFADSDDHRAYYERAGRKAEELGRAAEWLAQSAGAFASGEGREGERLRADAETPLETARDIPDPVPPDEFPPEDFQLDDATAGDIAATGGAAGNSVSLANGPGDASGRAALGEPAAGGADAAAADGFTRSAGSDGADGSDGTEGSDGGGVDSEEGGGSDGRGGGAGNPADADRIDDAELAEIAAELEEQSGDASHEADGAGRTGPDGSGPEDGGPATDAEAVEGEVELDLEEPDRGGTGDASAGRTGGDEHRADDGRDDGSGDDGSGDDGSP